MLDLPQQQWHYHHHIGKQQEIASQVSSDFEQAYRTFGYAQQLSKLKKKKKLSIHKKHYRQIINVYSQVSKFMDEERSQEHRQRNLTECDREQTPYKKQGRSLQDLISGTPSCHLQIPTAVISFPSGRIFSSSNKPTFQNRKFI